MKRGIYLAFSSLVLTGILVFFLLRNINTESSSMALSKWFTDETSVYIKDISRLKAACALIKYKDSDAVIAARQQLADCRLQYKRIAFFMEYFFSEQANVCNGPPVSEMDQGGEFKDPLGMQVIESVLYSDHPSSDVQEIVRQADLITRSCSGIITLMDDFKMEDIELIESMDQELVRVMTLYITGYDAPLLGSGIEEAGMSIHSIDSLLSPFLKGNPQKDSIHFYLNEAEHDLTSNPDFNSFDRLRFITRFALPAERLINEIIYETGPSANNLSAMNYGSGSLFDKHAFDRKAFPHHEGDTTGLLIALGRKLFYEKSMSENFSRSCESCHSPDAYFTDRLPRNRTMNGKADLFRNTPTLLYAGYQYAQFWDGRVQNLEDQVNTVVKNQLEMNATEELIIKRLQNDAAYSSAFEKIWPHQPISFQHTSFALSAYVKSLAPFNSAFDEYLSGNSTAMNASGIRGFNVFMGKAKCGTCHFAPLFNGLLPPLYLTTEFEILGIPVSDDFNNPVIDKDPGRFDFAALSINKGAFKTPVLRNIAETAPYMHNGAFRTLEKVIDFYDRGGGAGLGLDVPEQTLSSSPLHLSKEEKEDIIAFLHTLSDKQPF